MILVPVIIILVVCYYNYSNIIYIKYTVNTPKKYEGEGFAVITNDNTT